jgi:hypothetical protein
MSEPNSNQDVKQLQQSLGTNWYIWNFMTLNQWVETGSNNIELLETAIQDRRTWLRRNALLGILLSTLSGTLSASQINAPTYEVVFVFTVLSFFVAFSAGLIKVYQIQESLEKYIDIKQQWIGFTTLIISELQLPVSLRQDATYLIWKHKGQYMELLKTDIEVPQHLRNKAEARIANHIPSSIKTTLPNVIRRINDVEEDMAFRRHIQAEFQGYLEYIGRENEVHYTRVSYPEASQFRINDTPLVRSQAQLPTVDYKLVMNRKSETESDIYDIKATMYTMRYPIGGDNQQTVRHGGGDSNSANSGRSSDGASTTNTKIGTESMDSRDSVSSSNSGLDSV